MLRSRRKTEATEIETVRMKRLANSILGQDACSRTARLGEISSGRASMGRNGESGAASCVTIFSAPVLMEEGYRATAWARREDNLFLHSTALKCVKKIQNTGVLALTPR